MTDSTPNLDLPYILASQAQKEVTHNEALNRLDAGLHVSVLDRDLTVPPGSPADGDRYLVAAAATGAWAGQDGRLAAWYDGWIFLTPAVGWTAWVADEGVELRHDGDTWAEADHNALPGAQGGAAAERYHLTAAQHADLTDGGNATVHRHATAASGVDGFLSGSDKAKLDGIEAGAEVNDVTSVQGRSGAVVLTAADMGLGSGDKATFAGIALSAVGKRLAAAANLVAVRFYDTSRDSDGGAWVDRCAHLSWHGETLNTATRGATRSFPRLALVIAHTDRITIHDATDPALPMWMVFNVGGAPWPTVNMLGSNSAIVGSIAVRDGLLVVGGPGSGVLTIDFPKDSAARRTTSIFAYSGNIAARNAVSGYAATVGGVLNNASINDVAVTVLPFAPVDPLTGLPKPTIAVASDGGASVIHADGRVCNSSATAKVDAVAFVGGHLIQGVNNSDNRRVTPVADLFSAGWGVDATYHATSIPALPGGATATPLPCIGLGDSRFACGTTAGLSVFMTDAVKQAGGMVAHATRDYATGWLPGDIRLALSEKDTTVLAVGSAVADRSAKGNDGVVVGSTITRTAVAGGADLACYSGFGSSTYIDWSYDADFDFAAGDFCVLLWDQKSAVPAGSQILLARANAGGTGAYWELLTQNTGEAVFTISDGANSATVTTTGYTAFATPVLWQQVAAVRRGQRLELWVNGRLLATAGAGAVGSLTNATALLRLGQRIRNSNSGGVSRIALPRVTAYAPSPGQIARLHADEAPLFQANAKCLLAGTSNHVDALAHDSDTDRLLAAGPDGTSVFKGLRRVAYVDGMADANLTSDDHKAVTAARGGHAICSTAEVAASLPALTFRDEMSRVRDRPRAPDTVHGRTADATPTDIVKLPMPEGRSLLVEATVEGREHVDGPGERAGYLRRALFYREHGGNVTLAGAVSGVDIHESAAGMDCTLDADTAAQTVDLNVTGIAGKTIGWVARLAVTRLPHEERLP